MKLGNIFPMSFRGFFLSRVEHLRKLRDDLIQLPQTMGFGKILFRSVSHAFGYVLGIAGSTPNDFSDGIIAVVALEEFQDVGAGLEGHFIVEDEKGGKFGCRAGFEIPDDVLSVVKKFKGDAGMVFEDSPCQHFLVVGIVIRQCNVRWVRHMA